MNKKPRTFLSLMVLLSLLLFWSPVVAMAADVSDDYLHAVGNTLQDDAGRQVRLTGIAWFGFETPEQVYHGLWSVNMEDTLDTVANQGFNILRVPLSVQLVNQWRSGSGGTPSSVNYSANPDLTDLTSLQILDASISYCKKIGLKVMLDMHRVVNTQMLNTWYTDGYPPSDFEACWQWLTQHYANDDTVIAMDVFNEPHGAPGDADMARWDDSTDRNNWKIEAEKVGRMILNVNPKLLIVVEGIEATPKEGYTYAETNSANYDFNWWGGNLRGVRNYPVDLGNHQAQLVYSPHDYGPSVYAQPWFYSGFTQASLTADCWEPNWLYIALENIAPVLVGEWGGRMDEGDNEKWMGFLSATIARHQLNHTFWCVNPNSGDTGGILLDDWASIDTAKYNLIEPTLWKDSDGKYIGLDHQVNLGPNGTHVGAATTSDDDDTTPGDDDSANLVAVTGVNIEPTQLEINSGGAQQLIATVVPADATNQTVTWSSGDTSVAEVDSTGQMTAVADGTATITVTTEDGDYFATCTVTVTGMTDDTKTSCDAPQSVTLPLMIDGEGQFCRVTSEDISHINSWNMQLVEINGVDYTNGWFADSDMPERINGNYYIYYEGNYPWSHIEVYGSGGDDQNDGDDQSNGDDQDNGDDQNNEDDQDDENNQDGNDTLPTQCDGACNAAEPVYPTIQDDGGIGNVTMYSTSASSGGACNYGTTNVMYYAAMSVNVLPGDAQGQWQSGRVCGQCAEVTAVTSQGHRKVIVRIMDKCPDAFCGIDLGGEAPATIMLDDFGRYTGQWRFVSCEGHPEVSDGPPALSVFDGSNPWWSRVHIRNGTMATDTIEWRNTDNSTQGIFPYAADPENTFEVPVNNVLQVGGNQSFLITVHYVDGSTATVTLTANQLAAAGASYPLD